MRRPRVGACAGKVTANTSQLLTAGCSASRTTENTKSERAWLIWECTAFKSREEFRGMPCLSPGLGLNYNCDMAMHVIANPVPTPEEMARMLGLSSERVVAVRKIMNATSVRKTSRRSNGRLRVAARKTAGSSASLRPRRKR